ncbi:MAG: hypothetical protein Q8764_00100 [Pigeon pea little leaf phytoplasma]|uniref:Uncharacterized protein n=1 Tax=Candidatus Phytoplasma fabacearum TaxID=2982628 RepID=A0ABU8ZTJ7_9MOLU|nr:hypothetical protein ['Bituminaria bituminosa' little leaf phytoplasma]MDV3148966.1 hypothetical protein [Pigeon pea little leaf phytoplasma]MDO7983465.1 hypothetical protein ['Bituminaria bituminosa' little leaf phytoplasma]MDO8023782.1 hypothetical protein ['Bituminaria bituminosa' little leaf phytoplasma]MDO8030399.1 hypothetical protein ['Bituminaria bituminosa' little leaf phytoplasma]MDV3153995.1 hypothetical protein [Pigeon pea little leaf phytoplasma]
MFWFLNKNKKVNSSNCKKCFSNQPKVENIVNRKKNVSWKFPKNRIFVNIISILIVLIIFVTIVVIPVGYFIYLIFQR